MRARKACCRDTRCPGSSLSYSMVSETVGNSLSTGDARLVDVIFATHNSGDTAIGK